jgi:hypothetical protein
LERFLQIEGAVSRRQIEKVFAAFLEAGIIEAASGYYEGTGPASEGRKTRLGLAKRGKELTASFAIGRKNLSMHISAQVAPGLRLKAATAARASQNAGPLH